MKGPDQSEIQGWPPKERAYFHITRVLFAGDVEAQAFRFLYRSPRDSNAHVLRRKNLGQGSYSEIVHDFGLYENGSITSPGQLLEEIQIITSGAISITGVSRKLVNHDSTSSKSSRGSHEKSVTIEEMLKAMLRPEDLAVARQEGILIGASARRFLEERHVQFTLIGQQYGVAFRLSNRGKLFLSDSDTRGIEPERMNFQPLVDFLLEPMQPEQ